MQASVPELTSGVAPARAEAPEAPEAGPGVCGGGGGTGRGLGGAFLYQPDVQLASAGPPCALRSIPAAGWWGWGWGVVCLPLIL